MSPVTPQNGGRGARALPREETGARLAGTRALPPAGLSPERFQRCDRASRALSAAGGENRLGVGEYVATLQAGVACTQAVGRHTIAELPSCTFNRRFILAIDYFDREELAAVQFAMVTKVHSQSFPRAVVCEVAQDEFVKPAISGKNKVQGGEGDGQQQILSHTDQPSRHVEWNRRDDAIGMDDTARGAQDKIVGIPFQALQTLPEQGLHAVRSEMITYRAVKFRKPRPWRTSLRCGEPGGRVDRCREMRKRS